MAQATFFKTFTSTDRTSTRTLLHEAIPITGAIVSGTYNRVNSNSGREKNIKVYSHGMFQSVYDYPYLSSSANHIFDIAVGCSTKSALSSSKSTHANIPDYVQIDKKVNIYNQMAQMLMGYELQTKEEDGTSWTETKVRYFDADADFSTANDKMHDAIFFNFSRLLTKDEIKKGSFKMKLGAGHWTASVGTKGTFTVADTNAASNYFINCPAGEYGILYGTNDGSYTQLSASSPTSTKVGLIFYQAGICVLTSSVFENGTGKYWKDNGTYAVRKGAANNALLAQSQPTSGTLGADDTPDEISIMGGNAGDGFFYDVTNNNPRDKRYHELFTGSTIDVLCDGIRNKIIDISFNNTTELNSTVYFCRAHHNEFNYSSNPTYLSGSQIRVKTIGAAGVGNALMPPRAYITTIGMYSADNELLAVAKLSEPIRKDPTNEVTLRVRLDY